MRGLLELSRDQRFIAFSNVALASPAVQGIVLDYDRIWLLLWRLRSQYPRRHDFERAAMSITNHLQGLRGTAYTNAYEKLLLTDVRWEPPDPTWAPQFWKDYARIDTKDSDSPIVIRVCLLPYKEGEELPRLEVPGGFRVIYERRSPARLSMPRTARRPLVGGVSLGNGPSVYGTLGGLLRDQHGNAWAVTCSHVLGATATAMQPAPADDPSASAIGNVAYATTLRSSPLAAPCNPRNPQSVINTVDLALIRVAANVDCRYALLDAGPVAAYVPEAEVNPGSLVTMEGRTSGVRQLAIGGLATTYRFLNRAAGTQFCFENMFELRWVDDDNSRPVQPGDSGAWVVQQGATGTEWAGMVIGEDSHVGYAQFAERVLACGRREYGLELSVR